MTSPTPPRLSWPEQLRAVARLARLGLEEVEVEALSRDLERIVAQVDLLAELPLDDVPPTAQLVGQAALRPDAPAPGLTQAEALAEAPRTVGGGFAVPGFVEEG